MVSQRVHFISGEIDESSVESLRSFLSLAEAEPTDEVVIVIDSEGGDFRCAFEMYSMLRSSSLSSRIRTFCSRVAMSSAVVVAQGASAGRRDVMFDCFYYIHRCFCTVLDGFVGDFERAVTQLRECDDTLVSVLTSHHGDQAGIIEVLDANSESGGDGYGFLSQQDLLRLGLADTIVKVNPYVDVGVSRCRGRRSRFSLSCRLVLRRVRRLFW